MLDGFLAYSLFRAIDPRSHLLLVGDVDQLPSVGAGDVLRDRSPPARSRDAAGHDLPAGGRQPHHLERAPHQPGQMPLFLDGRRLLPVQPGDDPDRVAEWS